jgi:hypothetical protein
MQNYAIDCTLALCSLGAQEGSENEPEIMAIFFCKTKNSVFLAKDVGYGPNISAKLSNIFASFSENFFLLVLPRENDLRSAEHMRGTVHCRWVMNPAQSSIRMAILGAVEWIQDAGSGCHHV